MFRRAVALKRAEDENVDSGAETAEWVNGCPSVSSGLTLASQLCFLAAATMEIVLIRDNKL